MEQHRPTQERLRQIAEEFRLAREARPKLRIPGLDQDGLRREIARQALAGKIEFNRKFPGSFDIEACRADYERVVGPLDVEDGGPGPT